MKRLSLFLAIFFALASLTGCEDANVTKLKKEIHTLDATCPINYGLAGDLISVKYHEKDNMVLIYYSLNEEMTSHVFLKQNRDNMLKQIRLSLSSRSSQEMLKEIVNAQASLMVIYKSHSTGKTIKYTLSTEDLKNIKDNPISETEIKKMILENSIAMQNTTMPCKIDEGMTMTKVSIVDENVVSYYQLDENIFNIKAMQKVSDDLKENLRQELIESYGDPVSRRELETVNALGMGFIYRYYGKDSKEYVDVAFTADELTPYLNL